MNWQHIRVLIRYDLRYSLSSAKGLLFLVFYGLFWFWILWKLTGGMANWLAQPEGANIASLLLDPDLVQSLFLEHSPTLSVYFLIALAAVPGFVIWGAADQTATDLGNRHLRFLLPRGGRLEIYLGRFFGAVVFIAGAELLTGIAATLVALSVDANADIITYSLWVNTAIILYSLPFIALMAWLSAWTASAGLAVLVGAAAYSVIAAAAAFLSLRWPEFKSLAYLLPNAFKEQLLSTDTTQLTIAVLVLGLYMLIYLTLGWAIFRKRDA
jgi:ABC-type transport system involved in multi-copper enzyme maturation permease subunit